MAKLIERSFAVGKNEEVDVVAGSKVLYRSSPGINSRYEEVAVEAITPAGFIKVRGRIFREDGSERKGGYYNASIRPFDAQLLAEERAEHERIQRRRTVVNYNWTGASHDLIAAVALLIDDEVKP